MFSTRRCRLCKETKLGIGLVPRVVVQYFAVLREQRGAAMDELEIDASTPAELYELLKARHNFSLPASSLRCAINDDFAQMDQPLKDNDTVTFIAPVAGG